MPATPEGEAELLSLPLLFDEVGEDLIEAVVHVTGRLIGHLRIDHALVQGRGNLVGLLAQRRGHAPDLIPIEVDGGDLRGITAVGDLVSFTVESEAGASTGDGLFSLLRSTAM